MGSLKKNYANSIHYLKNKKILSDIRSNDPVAQEEISNCLTQIFKEKFLKKLILPGMLIWEAVTNNRTEKSFGQALSLLFEDIRSNKFNPGKSNSEEYFFSLFKTAYFGYLVQQLGLARQQHSNIAEKENTASDQSSAVPGDYDITFKTGAVLEQLSQCYRDYFIWYYVDKFSVTQIAAITGLITEAAKENLWISREDVSRNWKRLFNFPAGNIINQQQYYLLFDYFENNLSRENETLFRRLLQENPAVRENLEHEIYFRFGINKMALISKTGDESKGAFQTAEEFITHVKQIAESAFLKKTQ